MNFSFVFHSLFGFDFRFSWLWGVGFFLFFFFKSRIWITFWN